jgi:hypothetical protein
LKDNPDKIWDKLNAEYNLKNENLHTHFRAQMAKLTLQPGGNVREHAQRYTELRIRYLAMGGSMDDDVFISIFLDTLPESMRIALSDYMSILKRVGQTITAEDVIKRAIGGAANTATTTPAPSNFAFASAETIDDSESADATSEDTTPTVEIWDITHEPLSPPLPSLPAHRQGHNRHSRQPRFLCRREGEITVSLQNDKNEDVHITLKDVLYAPSMAYTLVSIAKATDAGFKFTLQKDRCEVFEPGGKCIGKILRSPDSKLWRRVNRPAKQLANAIMNTYTVDQLHRALGHIAHDSVRKLVAEGHITGVQIDPTSKPSECAACREAKMTKADIPKTRTSLISSKYGEIVHSDVWGPAQTRAVGGYAYYVTFHRRLQPRNSHLLAKVKGRSPQKLPKLRSMGQKPPKCRYKMPTIRPRRGILE